ncbi:hypothetical protein MN608_06981 [Microdochium nivale]|nr:hypothetical protein MN608_06981 [Microdochium nivale]
MSNIMQQLNSPDDDAHIAICPASASGSKLAAAYFGPIAQLVLGDGTRPRRDDKATRFSVLRTVCRDSIRIPMRLSVRTPTAEHGAPGTEHRVRSTVLAVVHPGM